MHELSMALSIIDIVTRESAHWTGGKVRTIHLQLGPLSGVVKAALVSAFELARRDSPLAAAELVIEDVPLQVFCRVCQQNQTLAGIQDFCCPVCGTPCGEVVRGRELEIVAMEIEP